MTVTPSGQKSPLYALLHYTPESLKVVWTAESQYVVFHESFDRYLDSPLEAPLDHLFRMAVVNVALMTSGL